MTRDVLISLATCQECTKLCTGLGLLKDCFASQVFLEYIPSRIGIAGSAASDVLQKFLEKYFAWYFGDVTAQNLASCDAPTAEALKILVRSYLSDLRWHDAKTSGKKKLRSGEPEEPRRKLNPDKTGSSWENQSDTKVNSFLYFCNSLSVRCSASAPCLVKLEGHWDYPIKRRRGISLFALRPTRLIERFRRLFAPKGFGLGWEAFEWFVWC